MQQLFAGTAEIRGDDSAPVDGEDWFSPSAVGSELELSDPNGGWTTAPIPAGLAEGLAPELARQLDAFQTPMRVEAKQVAPEVAAAQKFADAPSALGADTAMEAALLEAANSRSIAEVEADLNAALDRSAQFELAAELAQRAFARDRQARIETPWLTPVVELEAPSAAAAPMVESAPTVEVAPELEPELRREARVWPFVVACLALIGLALAIDGQGAPAPVQEVKVSAQAPVAPPGPVVLAAEVVEEELAPVAIDVSENIAEATKLYNAGKYRSSISVLDQVLTDDPKSVIAWNLLGLARYDSLDAAGARTAAAKVLELDPKNARVQILLATLAFDANQKDEGRAALEKYLELEPNGSEVEEVKALLGQR